MEALARVSDEGKISDSRMTRYNAATSMLQSGLSMVDISDVHGTRIRISYLYLEVHTN